MIFTEFELMEKKDLRIVFMGTPEFAVESLQALVENEYNVVAVVTQPDKPVGRHQDTLQPPAVKVYAEKMGLPVLQPVKMKDLDFIDQLKTFNADLQVVVAFRMLPEVVWDMPRFGTFNVHAALLPQYRGAAPINWAVINGETQTGVTTFFLDRDIDTGRIIKHKTFDIPDDADVEYVYDGLMKAGAKLAMETIDLILDNVEKDSSPTQFAIFREAVTEPQDETKALKAAPKIFKETCEINWNQPSKCVYDFVRGLSPYPGAWSEMLPLDESVAKGRNNTLKIYKTEKTNRQSVGSAGTFVAEGKHIYVNTADYQLELKEIQLSGKKRMDGTSFVNGFKNINEFKLK